MVEIESLASTGAPYASPGGNLRFGFKEDAMMTARVRRGG
jgi:hypothetical protein